MKLLEWLKSKPQHHLPLLILIVMLVFAQTARFGFVWDDVNFILKWPEIRSLTHLPALLAGNLPSDHQGLFRPFRSVLYALSFQLYGENPAGYHLQAAIIHAAAVCLAYLILKDLFKKSLSALIGALLFAIHPLQVEAVTFIAATFDLWGNLFFLSAYYAFRRYQVSPTRKLFILTLLASSAAFFTFELTYTLPLIMALDLAYRPKMPSFASFRLPVFVSLLLVLVVILRTLTLGVTSPNLHPFPGFLERIAFAGVLFARYILAVVLPLEHAPIHTLLPGLTSLFQYDHLGLPPLIFPWNAALPWLLIPASLIMLFFKNKNPRFRFGLLWAAVALAPILQLLPQSTLFGERYVYLSLLGAIITLLTLAQSTVHRLVWLIPIYLVLTLTTLPIWRSETTLWSHTLKFAEISPGAHVNRANAYIEAGEIANAIPHYTRAIALNPRHVLPYLNLSIAHYRLGNIPEAKKVLEILLQNDPNNVRARQMLTALNSPAQ